MVEITGHDKVLSFHTLALITRLLSRLCANGDTGEDTKEYSICLKK